VSCEARLPACKPGRRLLARRSRQRLASLHFNHGRPV